MNDPPAKNTEPNDPALDSMRRLKAAYSDADILSAAKAKTTLPLVKVTKQGTPYKDGSTEDIPVRAAMIAAGITSATALRKFDTVEDADDFDFDFEATSAPADVQPLAVVALINDEPFRVALTGAGTHMKDGHLFHTSIAMALISKGGDSVQESCDYNHVDECEALLAKHNIPFKVALTGPRPDGKNLEARVSALSGASDADIKKFCEDAGPAITAAWNEYKALGLKVRSYGQRKTKVKATVVDWRTL
jgi:hypothetical protein